MPQNNARDRAGSSRDRWDRLVEALEHLFALPRQGIQSRRTCSKLYRPHCPPRKTFSQQESLRDSVERPHRTGQGRPAFSRQFAVIDCRPPTRQLEPATMNNTSIEARSISLTNRPAMTRFGPPSVSAPPRQTAPLPLLPPPSIRKPEVQSSRGCISSKPHHLRCHKFRGAPPNPRNRDGTGIWTPNPGSCP